MQKFNINSRVTVILTEFGATVLNQKMELLKLKMGDNFPGLFKNVPVYKAGDEYKSQMWQLMQDFGDVMQMHLQTPFKDCVMFLFEDDLSTERNLSCYMEVAA